MGMSLKDLVSMDFGSEKTASVNLQDDADMNKIAQELGLFGNNQTTTEPESQEKVASAFDGMGALYGELFPEDTFGQEKNAAAHEETFSAEAQLGAMAFDSFSDRFSSRLEKMAEEMLMADSQPEQLLPNNKPANAAAGIDTTPAVTNILPPQAGGHVVGQESQAVSAEKLAAAALKKHLILNKLI